MTKRCDWVGSEYIYITYHDEEWGVPVYDSRALWEKLILDGFQAGLSWITILKKRENFQEAFQGFDPNVIAQWGAPEVERLLQNEGIIRHRGKIEATISNARVWQEIEAEQGFSTYLWNYVGGTPIQNKFNEISEVPASTPLSAEISKDLKKRGFKFCGPTIVYAFMQAVGMVNDHLTDCPCYERVRKSAQT
ncbi:MULTISPECIES: DNA-3-methyladenine glycosylase I [Halocynthiibacter]|uniref:DNA-3-methyladenine glycosylase I n=1 Tax=Halocynthiibacter halioticoli TaxID=2986804 RepID=A0AAE3LQA8_9RHOB|nr:MULTISPECIES: DNA-3-methyladenine glycosylase I [Halocynthiibacter]MCV6823288.1 DNA-3-methyladenine glycosylase I [Halocynthiibacter halioticoli]MCW4056289.1 DNA-3-methyladenine glycosylase I [Halocynthiibacter sp. SDUM655004]